MHKKTEDFAEEEEETSSEDDSEESGRQGKFISGCQIDDNVAQLQFYIHLVYKATLCFTLKFKILSVNFMSINFLEWTFNLKKKFCSWKYEKKKFQK